MNQEPPHLQDKYDEEICELYVTEAARLSEHLMKEGCPREMAADVVQDSILATRLRWHVVRTYECPRGYLYRVAKNRMRRLLGKERTKGIPHPDPYAAAPQMETHDVHHDLELRLVIDEAISKLPPQVGRAARLYYLADRTVSQVAAMMGISQGTVKGYLREARLRLKYELGSEVDCRLEGEQ